MKRKPTVGGLAGLGIASALAASLCCIAPFLALLAGSSSLATRFSWLEPARPVLVGFTLVALGLAWYQKLKPRAERAACACEEERWVQSKTFLGVVTVFALLALAFPWYADAFGPHRPKGEARFEALSEVQYVEWDVRGMTCSGCETHIRHVVMQLPGVVEVAASYAEGSALVGFRAGKTDTAAIRRAIEKAGYRAGRAHLIVAGEQSR